MLRNHKCFYIKKPITAKMLTKLGRVLGFAVVTLLSAIFTLEAFLRNHEIVKSEFSNYGTNKNKNKLEEYNAKCNPEI